MSQSSINEQIFESYSADGSAFDELSDGTQIRAHWQSFVDVVNAQTVDELNERASTAQQLLSENGVTFKVFDDSEATKRPWQLDLLPFMMSPEDGETISAAIDQRARLLDTVVRDLYGPQELIKSGELPAEILFDQPGYIRAFHNLVPDDQPRLHYYGVELARAPGGQWWVMADRTDVADGAGYALEHRMVASRSIPRLIKRLNIQRLAPFFSRLRSSFEAMAPRSTENPRIALLSPGPATPGYFEDQLLARYLGFFLVEGGDLAVRNDHVALKTLGGLLPIDVIWRRNPEGFTDPVELGGASPHGVPGLLQAVRAGNVAMVNTPGSRIVETPVFMAFLPKLCQHLLGEDLKIPSIATWWCGDPAQLKFVLGRFKDLVIKPSFSSAGSDEFIVSALSKSEREQLQARVEADPARYVAQEKIVRSAAPVWKADGISSGHVALRAFAVRAGTKYKTMPGALVRVAPTTDPMELSMAAGDFSKDAWVIGTRPAGDETLLTPKNETIPLVRASSQLPSRSADNLFWLGRQLDRAGNAARLLRTVAGLLAGEDDISDQPEMQGLLRALSSDGVLDAGYAEPDASATLPPLENALPESIFDRTEGNSLRCTVDEIFRLASLVRDRISNDTWRSIRLQNSEFVLGESANTLSSAIESLDRLLLGLAGCIGLIQDGMVRGPAWQFLDMGRRVERCHWIAGLLEHTVVSSTDPKAANAIFGSLVDIFDCRITYRSRYLSSVRMAPLMDLLLCDETNPASLSAQIHALSDHIRRLPRQPGQAGKTPEQRHMLTCVHKIELADVHTLCANPSEELSGFLDEVLVEVDAVAEQITRTYLVHSGDLRQISDEGPQSP